MGKTTNSGTTYTDSDGNTVCVDVTGLQVQTNAGDWVDGEDQPIEPDEEGPGDVDGDGELDKYEEMGKDDLRAACADHEPPLPVSGTRADLIARLRAADVPAQDAPPADQAPPAESTPEG